MIWKVNKKIIWIYIFGFVLLISDHINFLLNLKIFLTNLKVKLILLPKLSFWIYKENILMIIWRQNVILKVNFVLILNKYLWKHLMKELDKFVSLNMLKIIQWISIGNMLPYINLVLKRKIRLKIKKSHVLIWFMNNSNGIKKLKDK